MSAAQRRLFGGPPNGGGGFPDGLGRHLAAQFPDIGGQDHGRGVAQLLHTQVATAATWASFSFQAELGMGR
jgi:hypothetical protein